MTDEAAMLAAWRREPWPWALVPALDAGPGDDQPLPDDVAHHLVRVLRCRDGATVVATDGRGRAARTTLSGDRLQVAQVVVEPDPSPRVEVLQGVGKRRKHDDVVRMLTELGIDRIAAVHTHRCQARLDHKAAKVRARWEAIAVSATTQSRRTHLPRVEGPVDLPDVLASLHPVAGQPGDGAERDVLVLVAHPGGRHDPLQAVADTPDRERIVCLVGPEGGLTDDEVADVKTRGGVVVGMGPTVLRTEHAGLALAAVVMAAAGRMRP